MLENKIDPERPDGAEVVVQVFECRGSEGGRGAAENVLHNELEVEKASCRCRLRRNACVGTLLKLVLDKMVKFDFVGAEGAVRAIVDSFRKLPQVIFTFSITCII